MDDRAHVAGLLLDEDLLRPLVGRAVGAAEVRAIDWRIEPLRPGAGNPASAGVFRLAGSATATAERRDWSMVMKAAQSPASVGWVDFGEDPEHWNYWLREVCAYESGLLADLPGGVLAPRCYGSLERGPRAWLWLEDVGRLERADWDAAACRRAARHLGQFHAAFATQRAIPDIPWLRGLLLRGWAPYAAAASDVLGQLRDGAGPFVELHERHSPADVVHLADGLADPEPWLAVLDGLPQTLCHNDTNVDNLQLRRTAAGGPALMVIDWQEMGRGPIGGDVALVTSSLADELGPTVWPADDSILASYHAGLAESGLTAAPAEVRLGYVLTSILRQGIFMFYQLHRQSGDGAQFVAANRLTLGRLVELARQARVVG